MVGTADREAANQPLLDAVGTVRAERDTVPIPVRGIGREAAHGFDGGVRRRKGGGEAAGLDDGGTALLDRLDELKKVCGILQESIVSGRFFLIVGIGINVKSSPKIKKYPTTYLNKETKKKINLNELVEKLKKAFVSNVIDKKYSLKKIAKNWNKYAFNINKFINFKINNKIYKGIFKGINNNGALILEHNNHKDYFTHGSLV